MGGVGLAIGSMIAGGGIVILIAALRGEQLIPQIPTNLSCEQLLELGFSIQQLQPFIDAGIIQPCRDVTIIVPDGGETYITQVDL